MDPFANLWAVILAGGQGSRFWPWSQPQTPKQFLKIDGVSSPRTLIQQTVARITQILPAERILVVGLAAHAAKLQEQLQHIPPSHFLLEPCGCNTAAPILLAAMWLTANAGDNAMQLVLPSDHHIAEEKPFATAIRAALQTVEQQDSLVTFGIKPTRAETGYGYIEAGKAIGTVAGVAVHQVARFHEKPELKQAETYLASGNHFWNSGMFLWRAQTIQQEFARYLPELTELCGQQKVVTADNQPLLLDAKLYEKMTSVSVDHGVMEHSEKVAVVKSDMPWSDVGGWQSLFEMLSKDAAGNVLRAKNALLQHCSNSLIHCPELEVIVAGVEDCIIAYHEGRLLVCHRDQLTEFRQMVEKLTFMN